MIGIGPSETREFSDIAERAGHRLRELGNLALPRIEHGALADQWAIPMSGPVAPAEVLARLANDVTLGDSNSKGNLQFRRTQLPRLRTSAGVATGNDRVEADHDPKSNSEPSSQWTSWMPDMLPPLVSDPMLASKVPAQIATDVGMPSLPSLLPKRAPGLPFPAVARAIQRKRARDETDAVPEDDLSNLSAKIKRILDEEARRHGINV